MQPGLSSICTSKRDLTTSPSGDHNPAISADSGELEGGGGQDDQSICDTESLARYLVQDIVNRTWQLVKGLLARGRLGCSL